MKIEIYGDPKPKSISILRLKLVPLERENVEGAMLIAVDENGDPVLAGRLLEITEEGVWLGQYLGDYLGLLIEDECIAVAGRR